jgi:subtilisin family serine protease
VRSLAGGVAVLATAAAFALPASGVAASHGGPVGNVGTSVAATNGSAALGSAVSVAANAFGVSSHKGPDMSHLGGANGPVIPASLLQQVQKNPKHVFNVIIQGKVGNVAALTRALHAVGNQRTGKPFRSIPGLDTSISGQNLLKVAQKYPSLLQTITLDQPLQVADYQDATMWPDSADVSMMWNSFDPNTGEVTGPAPQAPAIAFIDSGIDAADTTDFGSRVVKMVDFCSLCASDSSSDSSSTTTTSTSSSDPSGTTSSDPSGTTSSDPSGTTSSDSGSTTTNNVARFASDTASPLDNDLEGHGTMVAGVAAGSGPDYPGVAQNAPIVSLRVADANGESMESDVIAAADWILANKDTYGIKVVNISMAGSTPTSFQYDPLDQAVEKLWLSGVVVVVAAGNFGDGAPVDMSAAPGNDPFVITVGALDQNGTSDTSDDTVAPWSAYGFTADGFSKPDIAAPGRYMVMPAPDMSTTIAQTVPDRIVEPGYMWMSGTSFAAPVVAGAAAQILAINPDWTPDQVKGALMLTANYLPNVNWQAAGVGEVDGAMAASLSAFGIDPPNPNENLDTYVGTDPSTGQPTFDAAAWASAVSSDAAWSSAAWSSAAWASAAWASAAWASAAWSSSTFTAGVDTAMSSLATYTEATYSP